MYELAAEFARQLDGMASRTALNFLIALLHAPFLLAIPMGYEAMAVTDLRSLDAKAARHHRFAVALLSSRQWTAAIFCVFGLLLVWMAVLVYLRIVCFIELGSMNIGPPARRSKFEAGFGFTCLIFISIGWTAWAILKVIRAQRQCKSLGA
ncbi:MAG: hypothetical protein KF902_06675 [Phycisphaeraceae bacterium]|nr:hypothetical protein [Phycisphaeraceae bacterium]MCW5769678.1 hypothetical protein [Phycisphaeraceae bacterium]